MRSSDALRRAAALGPCLAALIAACTMPPGAEPPRGRDEPCVVAGPPLAPRQAALAQELQRRARGEPLFAASVAPSGVAACRIADVDGKVTVDYRSAVGNELRIQRDERIEYTDVEARFVAPPIEEPVALLGRAEHAAFGPAGCGIDWRRPETRQLADVAEARFRGDACNCQAIVRRNAAGTVVSLAWRSAC